MKNFVLMVFLVVMCFGCTRVPPGYVGIKVDMYGNQKGVNDFPLQTGRVWFNPFTQEIYQFPTYMQNGVWIRDNKEDKSITFNSVEGAVVNADISVHYRMDEKSVPVIFVEQRQNAEYITNVYVRSKVRDSFSRHASTMKVVDIFGAKKQQLLLDVKKDLTDELGPKGFNFDMVSFLGELRVDNNVLQSINMTIQASQKAIEAQNKVVQSKAEAEQQIETARGRAESILLEANAKAEANRKLTESLSPQLMQYEALQKWDGVMPKVTSGQTLPFIQVPLDK